MKIIFNILYWITLIIISFNIGVLIGKFITWSGLQPYLEKFFNWIVF